MSIYGAWDQATLTSIVREGTDLVLSQQDRVAPLFATTVPTTLRKMSKERIRVAAVGSARGILADDATFPIYRPQVKYVEEAWELFRLGEQTYIEESLRAQLELNGTDNESISRRERAGVDIATRIRAIALRNEVLSDRLVIQAVLNGQLQVNVVNPLGQTQMNNFVVDYEYPDGAITQAPTSFTQAGAKPVDVLRAAQQQTKNTSGRYATEFTMSSELLNTILTHADTIARFQFNTAATYNPQVTPDMLARLLWDPDNIVWHITDAGWFDEGAGYGSSDLGFLDVDKTRWIPKDTFIALVPGRPAYSTSGALIRTQSGQPVPDGTPDPDPFMTMYDGQVPVPISWNEFEYRGPGAQTYEILDMDNLTKFYRWEARRFPEIHHPERIAVVRATY